MGTEIAPNTKRCTICSAVQPRARFRTRSGTYDYRCVSCRKKPLTARQCRERVERGLMSEGKRKTVEELRAAVKREKLRLMMLDRYRKQHAATWEPLRASAMMAYRQLSNTTPQTHEAAVWEAAMRNLIREATTEMHVKMLTEDANPGWRFWYDFDPNVAAAAREHVKKYPGSNCPLIIL